MLHSEKAPIIENTTTTQSTPRHLICPITSLIYLEPVTIFPSGHIFEKEAIETVIALSKKTGKTPVCPISRKPIEGMSPAWSIASAVEVYLTANPTEKSNQYVRTQEPVANTAHAATSTITSTSPSTTAETNRTPEVMRQIEEDAVLARELAHENAAEIAERERVERERRTLAAFHAQHAQSTSSSSRTAPPRTDAVVYHQAERERQLSMSEKAECKKLIEDIQNIIFALGFEPGPKPRGRIDNFSLLFFAMIEQAFLDPLPWQKIKVEEGPMSPTMYIILKAAIKALKDLDPTVLDAAKTQYAGQYDHVKTVFGGELSLSKGGYTSFAKAMGTITNQPGHLVDQVLVRADRLLRDLDQKYSFTSTQQNITPRPHAT